MKKNRSKVYNQTISELCDQYTLDMIELQDAYERVAGHLPGHDDIAFWESDVVRKVGGLLELFADLKRYRQSEGTR